MTLHHATLEYLVYLKALGLPAKRLTTFRRVLADVEIFYGPHTPLQAFDNCTVLEYVRENDPFAGDALSIERGLVFCKFTHWLMKNRLIPAWSEEMKKVEKDHSYSCSSLDDFQSNDKLLL